MRKTTIFTLFLVLAVCVMPTYAVRPSSETLCINKVVSAYVKVDYDHRKQLVTLMIVSIGEAFILTDVVYTRLSGRSWVNLLENKTLKCSFWFEQQSGENSQALHLNSGVSFGPGSKVILDTGSEWGGYLISGYVTNCF